MFSVNEKYAKQGYKNQIQTLTALGFKYQDCVHALEMCDNQLDDAAIWLTQNAKTVTVNGEKSPLNIQAVEVSWFINCLFCMWNIECAMKSWKILKLVVRFHRKCTLL